MSILRPHPSTGQLQEQLGRGRPRQDANNVWLRKLLQSVRDECLRRYIEASTSLLPVCLHFSRTSFTQVSHYFLWVHPVHSLSRCIYFLSFPAFSPLQAMSALVSLRRVCLRAMTAGIALLSRSELVLFQVQIHPMHSWPIQTFPTLPTMQ